MSGDTESRRGISTRQRLYELINDGDLSIAEKQRQSLSLGRSYLGVEHAYIQRHEPDTDTDTIVCSVGFDPELFPEGTRLDRATSYCRRTVREQSPVALSNVPEQGWKDDPAYDEHHLDCYLGTTIYVEGEVYGTVCFISRDAKEKAFTTDEKLFVELLARLLGRELEASEFEHRLTVKEHAKDRRNRLIAVLERVLRHNIRNDVTAVGGLASVIADRTDGDIEEMAERIEAKAAELAELSDKARTLEETAQETESLEPRSLTDDVESVVADLRQQYSETVFRIDGDDVPAVMATDQLRLALRELGSNAAKYGDGTPVAYEVTAEADAGVSVRVHDDGPGLPEHERNLLETGEETPLEHGTGLGLWLVNWVVTGCGGHVTTDTEDGTTVTIHLREATEDGSPAHSYVDPSVPSGTDHE